MATKNAEIGTTGSWLPLLNTGAQGDKEITTNDLDAIADNFGTGSTNKVPISFGRPSAGGPVLGHIDAVERKGDTLHGRLSSVDPRLERLLRAGAMKKRVASVSGHGTPQAALNGVGMIHRQYVKGTWSESPATEAHLNSLVEAAGNVDAEANFSDKSAIGFRVEFVSSASRRPQIAADCNSRELNSLAKARAKEQSIGFCEALSQVASERSDLTRPRQNASVVDVNGTKLSTLAAARAKDQGISFGEALSQVARERPELAVPHFEFCEGR